MAAPSPALSNNSADANPVATTSVNAVISGTTPTASAAAATTTTFTSTMMMSNSSTNTSKNLRGLNKPKCIKCGNVARSRCPYQACKSCCAKAQNPCHIHVLKGGTSFPDKTPSSSAPLVDQHSNETSSSGNSHRITSLRQLSNNFAQFNNLQTPVRSRRPTTRKEAAEVNEWRFSKLKEYRDRNLEVENDAFDRYLQNVSLLEEVFAVNSRLEEPRKQESVVSNPNVDSVEEENEKLVSEMKLRLSADPARIGNFRERMQFIVNNGLRKLKRSETQSRDEEGELVQRPKKERYLALCDLNKKLSNARTEEDLKACQLLKAQLFSQSTKSSEESAFSQTTKSSEESETIETTKQQDANSDMSPKRKSEYSPPKWFRIATVDQETLKRVNEQFCPLEEIEQL